MFFIYIYLLYATHKILNSDKPITNKNYLLTGMDERVSLLKIQEPIVNIRTLHKKKNILDILQDSSNSIPIKMEYIQMYKDLFVESHIIDLHKGGLYDDWDDVWDDDSYISNV